MKKLAVLSFLAVFTMGLSKVSARSILPMKGPMDVHYVQTELRSNGQGGFNGPITIVSGESYGAAIVTIDNNLCSKDGLCTEMAPIPFTAAVNFDSETDAGIRFAVELSNPRLPKIEKTIYVTVFYDTTEALVETDKGNYKASSYVWVVKSDESITCQPYAIDLDTMALELSQIGIEIRQQSKAISGAIQPTVCGIKSSSLNAYLIPAGDLAEAQALGFRHLDAYPYATLFSEY